MHYVHSKFRFGKLWMLETLCFLFVCPLRSLCVAARQLSVGKFLPTVDAYNQLSVPLHSFYCRIKHICSEITKL